MSLSVKEVRRIGGGVILVARYALFSLFLTCACAANPCIHDETPSLFGHTYDRWVYFHTHRASLKELEAARPIQPVFEIDLAWAHSSFNAYVTRDTPYIGHPEEFYTRMGKEFPADNVTLTEFQSFLHSNPAMKVLIDIKDACVFPYLEAFVKAVGPERCIAHAFIKNWTYVPPVVPVEPHWYREDIDLFALNEVLERLGVPLIANCRGFNDENVEENAILAKMIEDSRHCASIVCLGLYYTGVILPKVEFLKSINDAGYFAWVNGNLSQLAERIGSIKYIAMSDDLHRCTGFRDHLLLHSGTDNTGCPGYFFVNH